MDMLGEWVRRFRWRGMDTVLAHVAWAWLYRHTCGQARRLLQTLEEREKPFELGKKLISVELKRMFHPKTHKSMAVKYRTFNVLPDVLATPFY